MKLEIYDLTLKLIGSYPFELDKGIDFDLENECKNNVRIFIDEDYDEEIVINHFVFFHYANSNRLGKIIDLKQKGKIIDLTILLNADIFTNSIFNYNSNTSSGYVFENSIKPIELGISEYFNQHTNVTPFTYVSEINDFDMYDSVIYTQLSETFKVNDYIRKMQANRHITTNLTLKYDQNTNGLYIEVRVSKLDNSYIVFNENYDVLGLPEIDFQNDVVNCLNIQAFNSTTNKFIREPLTYILNTDNVVELLEGSLGVPTYLISNSVVFSVSDNEISDTALLAFAIDELANAYNNEIKFKTKLTSNIKLNELMGRYAIFILKNGNPIFSRISGINLVNGIAQITLGASRKRLTDKLKRRL